MSLKEECLRKYYGINDVEVATISQSLLKAAEKGIQTVIFPRVELSFTAERWLNEIGFETFRLRNGDVEVVIA